MVASCRLAHSTLSLSPRPLPRATQKSFAAVPMTLKSLFASSALLVAALAALASVASAAGTAVNYPRTFITGTTYPTPVRFQLSGFTNFDPAVKYTATVCDLPVILVSGTTALSAVVRLRDRVTEAAECKLALLTPTGEKAFEGGSLSFIVNPAGTPAVNEYSPSFYYPAAKAVTRIRIKGADLNKVAHVALAGSADPTAAGFACTNLQFNAAKLILSCVLPQLVEDKIPKNAPIRMSLYTAAERTAEQTAALALAGFRDAIDATAFTEGFSFDIESLAGTELPEIVEVKPNSVDATVPTLVTIKLAKAIPTLTQQPWRPILLDTALTGVDASNAKNAAWAADGLSLSFSFYCEECTAGNYIFGIGEDNSVAGAVVTAAKPSALSLPACDFASDVFPATASAAAVASGSAEFVVRMTKDLLTRKITTRIGYFEAAATVEQFPLSTKAGVMLVTPVEGSVIAPGAARITFQIGERTDDDVVYCDIPGFTVTASEDISTDAYVTKTLPHALFLKSATATPRLRFLGKGLKGVTDIYATVPGLAEAVHCTSIDSTEDNLVTCDFPALPETATVGTAAFTLKLAVAEGKPPKFATFSVNTVAEVVAESKESKVTIKNAAQLTFTLKSAISPVLPYRFVIVDSNANIVPTAGVGVQETATTVVFPKVTVPALGVYALALEDNGVVATITAAKFTVVKAASGGGLSDGAIAAIVIGIIVLVVVAIVIVRRKKQRQQANSALLNDDDVYRQI